MRAFALLLVFAVAPASAQIIPGYDMLPDPNEYGPCDVDARLFATLPSGLENLHFHNGSLYLTAFGDGLYRASPDGTFELVVRPDPVPSPTPLGGPHFMMGVTSVGGSLFVSQGQSVVEPVAARILRFDAPGSAEWSVFADGFDGANGLAADGDGNLYLAHGFREGVYKVLPDGTWSLWLDLPTVNGVSLHPDGERVVVAQVADTGSHVLAVSLADPAEREVLFRFNALDVLEPAADPTKALVTKLIDDLAVHPDGRVFVTSHERLQTLVGDPATGATCLLKGDHGDAPTSVRLAHGFGDWDGWLFSTDNAGEVWAFDVRTPGEPAPAVPPPATTAEPLADVPGPGLLAIGLALGWAAARRARAPRS